MDVFGAIRHYLVRRRDSAAQRARDTAWLICCDGRELASMPERGRAIELANRVARADHEEFGTQTEVLIEEDDGVRQYACFRTHAKLC